MAASPASARDWAEDVSASVDTATERAADRGSAGGEALAQKTDELLPEQLPQQSRMAIVRTVRLVGGAMITILLVAVVLNEVFGAVNIGSGPFSGIATDLQTTGVAALGLLVVGLLIVAANALMGIFGGGGGGGGM